MTELTAPDAALHAAWRAAVDEFGDHEVIHGSGTWDLADADRRALTPARFAAVVAGLRSWADPARPLPADRVHCDYLWITEDDHLLGFLALRHGLNAFLLDQGGHIGFSVRPSRRREGHASRALGLAVRRAAGLGLDRVPLTCDEDNRGSARTIERTAASTRTAVAGSVATGSTRRRRIPHPGSAPARQKNPPRAASPDAAPSGSLLRSSGKPPPWTAAVERSPGCGPPPRRTSTSVNGRETFVTSHPQKIHTGVTIRGR